MVRSPGSHTAAAAQQTLPPVPVEPLEVPVLAEAPLPVVLEELDPLVPPVPAVPPLPPPSLVEAPPHASTAATRAAEATTVLPIPSSTNDAR
jgi:hypothetical protein